MPPAALRCVWDGPPWSRSLGNPRGVIENLEAIDLETPGFTEADRAAFLLGQAYLRIGSVDRFIALTRAACPPGSAPACTPNGSPISC